MGFAAAAILLLLQQPSRASAATEIAKGYEAARADPSEANVFALANRLAVERQYSEAAKFFAFGLERYPKSARMRVGASVAAHGEGRFDDAVDHLCSAVDLDPADPRPLYFLGQMYDLSPSMAAEVTRRLEKFVELYPANAYARLYYAVSRAKAGSGDAAVLGEIESHFSAAVRLAPRLAEAWFEFGSFLERNGHPDQAELKLAEAVRFDSQFRKAWYRLAMVRRHLGKAREAAEAMDRFRKLGSGL